MVREIGSAVRDISVGDHVLLSYSYCGACHSCTKQRPYQCIQMSERNFGACRRDGSLSITWNGTAVHGCFFGQSSFSNPALVQETSCVRIDKKYPLEQLAPLGCGVQTGAGAVFNVVKPSENGTQSLLIFGIGGVGSAALMAAKVVNSDNPHLLSTVIAVDMKDDRLLLAKKLGATHVIKSASVEDTIAKVRRITSGEGVDAAIDCTGAIPIINAMINALGPGGAAVTVGAPPAMADMSIRVFPFINGCKTYRGSNQGNSYSKDVRHSLHLSSARVYIELTLLCIQFLPFLADLHMQGRLPIDQLQKQYAPEDINKAVQDLSEGVVVKPVIIWR